MRVFISSYCKFPRGDAGANYIQYLSLALKSVGVEVVVLGVNAKLSKDQIEFGEYKGIPYLVCALPTTIERQIKFKKKFYSAVVDKYSITKDDIVLCYTSNYAMIKYFSNIVSREHTYLIRVEDMQSMQFKGGIFNPNFIMLRKAIKYAQKKCAGTLSISSKIQQQDVKAGAQSMLLPILADPYEYNAVLNKPKDCKVQFIYSGMKINGLEDDIEAIFKALLSLDDGIRSRIELHITGSTRDKIKEFVGTEKFAKIADILKIHGFLPYDELVKLYQRMDFLLLPRKKNAITEANFPSKIPELMSYGVIPICTDVGDYTKYYLSDSNAIIMPDSNTSNIVKSIITAVQFDNDKFLEKRSAARKLIEEQLYYELWSERVYEFLFGNKNM